MDPSERIARMEADGIITPKQAFQLRDGLNRRGARPGGATPKARQRSLVLVLWALIGIAIIASIAAGLVGPNGDNAIQDVTQTLNQQGGHGEMNRMISAMIAVALLLVLPLLLVVWLHNSLISKEEKVFEAWAQTESNFQRRADLVPALVETVSRYLKHEKETQIDIAKARSGTAEQLFDSLDDLIEAQRETAEALRETGQGIVEDDARLQRLYERQASVGQIMGSIFAVAEAYPELRSSDQFLELQAQLEGTENRINVARIRFNDAVREYNATARMLPWSLIANVANFQRKAYFRSEEEARRAPELAFD